MLSTTALLAVITLLLINHYFAVYCTFYEHNCFRVDMWSPTNACTATVNVNKKTLHAYWEPLQNHNPQALPGMDHENSKKIQCGFRWKYGIILK